MLLEAYYSCPSERAILSTYPSGYELGGPEPTERRPTVLVAREFGSKDGMLRLSAKLLREPMKTVTPSRFWASGFSFAPSQSMAEVPYSPNLPYLFFGEETSMAARLWTHGWDFFVPTEAVVYHLWTRSYRRTFQEVQPPRRDQHAEESRAKVRCLLTGEAAPSPFGLGTRRTLADWVAFTGVNFATQSITEEAQRGGLAQEMFADDANGAEEGEQEQIDSATQGEQQLQAAIPDAVREIMKAQNLLSLGHQPAVVAAKKKALPRKSQREADLFGKLSALDPSLSGKIINIALGTELEAQQLQEGAELPFTSPFLGGWEAQLGSRRFHVLSPEQVQELHRVGFVLLRNVFPVEIARAAKQTACEMGCTDKLKPAGMSRDAGNWKDARARGDLTQWLHPGTTGQEAFEPLMKIFQHLREDLGRVIGLRRPRGEYQLALYPGGGSGYVRHRDAFPQAAGHEAQTDMRHVTAIAYTSEGWQQEDGGCLRVYLQEDDNGSVDIEPRAGNMVVFLSGLIEHEVLPSYTERVALTSWYR